jgi:hypothetical protein
MKECLKLEDVRTFALLDRVKTAVMTRQAVVTDSGAACIDENRRLCLRFTKSAYATLHQEWSDLLFELCLIDNELLKPVTELSLSYFHNE